MADENHREDTTQVLDVGPRHTPDARSARDICTFTVLAGATPGAIYSLDAGELVFGRGDDCHVRIDDTSLSRRHARVVRIATDFYVEDLESTNGTWINGDRIQRRRLHEGDRLQLGPNVLFSFRLQDALEQEAARKLYESAVRDPLTQAYNRRYLEERLTGEFAFAVRHQTPLTVMLVDADHFKSVNDRYGHPAGDEVLKSIAATMQRLVRTEDLVARIGGEEFCVLARGIDSERSLLFAERLRRTLEQTAVRAGEHELHITVSVGIVTMTADRAFPDTRALLGAADDALYSAKRAGRNRTHRV